MSLLSVGDRVQVRDRTFRVDRALGSGMTSEVYLVRDETNHPYALKCLRPHTSQDVQSLFYQEMENLQRIQQAWEEVRKRPQDIELLRWVHDLPLPAPRFLLGDNRCFVMEYIQGPTAEDAFQAWREKQIEQIEYWGLTVALQLGLLLWVLHEQVQRCYSDMKIGNLILVRAPSPPFPFYLKIIDWSVLNPVDTSWVQKDLFLASLIVYQLITGESLPRLGLRISVPMGQAQGFKTLSQGMQRFLRQALSPVLRVRHATAQAWTEDILTLWKYWAEPEENLLRDLAQRYHQVRRLLDAYLHDPKPDVQHRVQIQRFAEAYFVAEIRSERALPETWAQIYKEYTELLHPLSIGERALRGLSFDLAKEQFAQGEALFPEEKEKYSHWWLAADGAQHMDPEIFRRLREDILEGVKALTEGQWEVAYGKFLPVAKALLHRVLDEQDVRSLEQHPYAFFMQRWAQQDLPQQLHNGLFWIFLEILGVRRQRDAEAALRRGELEKAKTYVEELRQIWHWLPKEGDHFTWFLSQAEIADLQERVFQALRLSEAWKTLQQKLQEALTHRRWSEVYAALRELWEFPQHREFTLQHWREAIRVAWQQGDVSALKTLINGLGMALTNIGKEVPSELKQLQDQVLYPVYELHRLWKDPQLEWPLALWASSRRHWEALLQVDRLEYIQKHGWGPVRKELTIWIERWKEVLVARRSLFEEPGGIKEIPRYWEPALVFLAMAQKMDDNLARELAHLMGDLWQKAMEQALSKRDWSRLRSLFDIGRTLKPQQVWAPIYQDAIIPLLGRFVDLLEQELKTWEVLQALLQSSPDTYQALFGEMLHALQSLKVGLEILKTLDETGRWKARIEHNIRRITKMRALVQRQKQKDLFWRLLEDFAQAILHGDVSSLDWRQAMDSLVALQDLGATTIPEEYPALRKYVKEIIGNENPTEDLESMRQWLVAYYRTPEILTQLEIAFHQGAWERVWVDATRLLRWWDLSKSDRERVTSYKEQAGRALAFLAWAEHARSRLMSTRGDRQAQRIPG